MIKKIREFEKNLTKKKQNTQTFFDQSGVQKKPALTFFVKNLWS